jgi:simple sugar transport system permease protein
MLRKPEVGSLAALLALIAIFSLLSPNFLSLESWGALIGSSTEVGIIALGVTLLLIAGEIDLSVGALFAACGVFYAHAALKWGIHPALAFPATLVLGGALGAVNGLLTVKTKLPSFIVTLGAMMFWQGLVLVLTHGFPISDLDSAAGLHWLAADIAYGFRTSFVLWIALGAAFIVLLRWSSLGNWIMATGGNEQAAFAMGIPTGAIKIFCFAATGALSALAAIIQFAHLESISPVAGESYALKAIAVAVMGGTALSGGVGTVLGSIIGTLIMGVLTTGLVQAGISNYWFRAIVGVILIAAVLLNGRMLKLLKVEA